MAAGAIMAGQAAFDLWSGYQNAQTIRRQGAITASINELNAKYADIDAENAEDYGATEVAAYEPQIVDVIASQRTAMAAADVDVSYGTAQDIQNEAQLKGFLNKTEIQNQAHAKALGYKRQASNIRLQGTMGQLSTETNAAAAQTQGAASAAATGIKAYSRF